MRRNDGSSKLLTPSQVVWTGLVVGTIGLVMALLGVGGVAPVRFIVSGINLDVQTTSVAVVILIVGFATALSPLVMAMWVDIQSKRSGQARDDLSADPNYVAAVFRGGPLASSESNQNEDVSGS